MSLSLTLQPNLFQLFHPIGGVAAIVADCARASCGDIAAANRASDASKTTCSTALTQHTTLSKKLSRLFISLPWWEDCIREKPAEEAKVETCLGKTVAGRDTAE